MLCEVLTTKLIKDRQYATVKAGQLVGEVPVTKGVVVVVGEKVNVVPILGSFNGRLQAHLVLTK